MCYRNGQCIYGKRQPSWRRLRLANDKDLCGAKPPRKVFQIGSVVLNDQEDLMSKEHSPLRMGCTFALLGIVAAVVLIVIVTLLGLGGNLVQAISYLPIPALIIGFVWQSIRKSK